MITTTNTTTKKYNCIRCNKTLSSRQSKWRHENTCNQSTSIDNRITQLEHTIIPSIDANIKHLNMLINNIVSTYDIVKHNFFNKFIISNESNFNFLINNNIDIYFSISKLIPSYDRNIKYNLKYLNKLRSLLIKNSKYGDYIDKLIFDNPSIVKNDKKPDYESDTDSNHSLYSDISDF
jgi:hypothetical protein